MFDDFAADHADRHARWGAQDERDARGSVKHHAFAEPLELPLHVAVVGGVADDGVGAQPEPVECGEHAAEVQVGERDVG